MTSTRQIQIAALSLTLLAGFLWSQRLTESIAAHEIRSIQSSDSQQIEELRLRIEDKTDGYELISMGRKLLSTGNSQFAIVPLEKGTELVPGYRDGWYLLGFAYVQASDDTDQVTAVSASQRVEYRAKAQAALERARAIDPTHQPTNDLLRQLQNGRLNN